MYLLLRGRFFSPSLFFSFSNDGTKGTYALICEMAQPLKGLAFKPDDLSLIPGPT